jgi:hypothetical protein
VAECGEKDCPGGHDDIQTQHCNPKQLVQAGYVNTQREKWGPDPSMGPGNPVTVHIHPMPPQPVTVSIVVARKRNENCPACGHRSFFRRCKCGALLW